MEKANIVILIFKQSPAFWVVVDCLGRGEIPNEGSFRIYQRTIFSSDEIDETTLLKFEHQLFLNFGKNTYT